MRVAEKVVRITGASEGIGAACARHFHERGARTAVTPRVGWILMAARALFPGFIDGRLEKMYRSLEME